MPIFSHIFLSNYWRQESDIWPQASYRYAILWEAFLDPSDSYFLFVDFVDFYTHWIYMLIFRRIFLSNYWWQKSDIWSQASYKYPISWEAFLDPSDSYFLFAEEWGYHKWVLAHSSSCLFCYIAQFLPLIYPPELEVKETTDTASSASFLDLYLEFDDSGQLSTKIYDKRDDFNFKIINFPNMCSNIPASPAYGVYISQLIRYARASSNYSDFLKRHLHLRNRLLDQGYKKIRLIRSLKKFIFRYQYLVEIYSSLQKKLYAMHFHIVKMYKDKEVKMSRIIFFLSMCDVKIFLTFTSPNMVLLWQLFYLFCSCI